MKQESKKMGYAAPKSGKKVMGHDGGVSMIPCNYEQYDMKRVQRMKYDSRGNPPKAYDYQW